MFKYLLTTVFISFTFLHADLIIDKKTKTAEGVGVGQSREEAVNNAIAEAIGQLNGVSIKKEILVDDTSTQSSNSDTSDYKYNSKIKKITDGKADSYTIIHVEKCDDKKYEATVSITKTTIKTSFKAPGIGTQNRRTIAVMPFYISQSSFTIGSQSYSSTKIADIIAQAITTNMTQSRKFAVIDKTYTHDMEKELNLIASNEVPLSQKIKLGQKLGADYLLVGTIQRADMQVNNNLNRSTGETSSQSVAEFIIDYRVIVVGTSQIKWSDTTKIVLDMSNSDTSINMRLQNAVETVSAQITNTLLGNIYPIQVVKITPMGEIILNQGGNLVKKDSIFNVFKLGENICDPYTKESLGQEEIQVATIEITKVNPKTSYAKVIEGTLSLVKNGYICRVKSQNLESLKIQDNKDWKNSSVEVQENGGIKLPFD